MSDPLVAFLRSCLDEDERVARKNTGDRGLGNGGYPDYRTYGGPDIEAADEFIGHFTPERVLAEVESKREILRRYEVAQDAVEVAQGTILAGAAKLRLATLEIALHAMTIPYVDRPGYDPAWRVME